MHNDSWPWSQEAFLALSLEAIHFVFLVVEKVLIKLSPLEFAIAIFSMIALFCRGNYRGGSTASFISAIFFSLPNLKRFLDHAFTFIICFFGVGTGTSTGPLSHGVPSAVSFVLLLYPRRLEVAQD